MLVMVLVLACYDDDNDDNGVRPSQLHPQRYQHAYNDKIIRTRRTHMHVQAHNPPHRHSHKQLHALATDAHHICIHVNSSSTPLTS